MGLFDKLLGRGGGTGSGGVAELEARAKESIERGRERAIGILDTQAAGLAFRCTQDPELGELLEEVVRRNMLLGMKMQFLWGFFFMHVQEFDLPTNGFDRIKLHLIDWLINEQGYGFEIARDNANDVEDQYNGADPVFDSISALGKEAYAKHGDHYFFVMLSSVRSSGGLKPAPLEETSD